MSLLNRSQPRGDAELNLIPLIDIMSVLVAFLLIYSTEVEVVQNSKGIEIPQSSAEVKPQSTVVVMITREHLFVQGRGGRDDRRSPKRHLAADRAAAPDAGAADARRCFEHAARVPGNHRDCRQEPAVRSREKSDGHLQLFLVRKDFAGRPAKGEGSPCS
jgi:hypothetical protein